MKGKKEKLLLTGVSGFVGRHLVKFLLGRHYSVWGLDVCAPPNDRIFGKSDFNFIKADLLKSPPLDRIIGRLKPTGIFHLAGASNVASSWKDPEQAFRSNLLGGQSLLAALARINYPGKILMILSGEEYGQGSVRKKAFREDDWLRPCNPYAASKAALDYLSLGYYLGYGLKIIRLRPFNHIGPGQKATFVVADFSRQIALIEAGKQEALIRVGNLQVARDFLDVGDVVRAYFLAYKKGVAGEVYNICSGRPVFIEDILKKLLEFSKVKIKVKISPDKFRKAEQPVLSGDNGKFRKLNGWRPGISLERSLLETLNYWRRLIRIKVK